MNSFQAKFDPSIWKIVASIPSGQVMAYGEIARAAGYPRYSRMVAAAMGRCPEPLPWFRVVRSGKKVIAATAEESLDKMLWGPRD